MPPSPSDGRVAPNILVAPQHIAALNNSSTTTTAASADNSTTNDAIGNGTNINIPIAALTTAVNNAATYPINTINTQGASHTIMNVCPPPQFYNHPQNNMTLTQPLINGAVTTSLGSTNGIFLAQPQLVMNTQQLPSTNTNTIVHPHLLAYAQQSILPIQSNNSDVGTSPNTSNSPPTTNNTSNADESTTTNTSNSSSTAYIQRRRMNMIKLSQK